MSVATAELKQLRHLARLYGLQPSYCDIFGRLNQPPPEALCALLRMLGAPLQTLADLGSAMRVRRQELAAQRAAPVIVLWDGGPRALQLRVPAEVAEAAVKAVVQLENGETVSESLTDDGIFTVHTLDGVRVVKRRVKFSSPLPLGYHRLHLEIAGRKSVHHLFVAPLRSYGENHSGAKSWGLFAPLYSLHSDNSWAVGDFADLRALVEFTGQLGGAAVGTLPLFAAFLDEPFNPSPYSPVSRLFWNELFLALQEIPEMQHCVGARAILRSSAFETEMGSLRAAPLVDYRRAMALKRKVLNELLTCLLKQPSQRREQFERFCVNHELAQDYAAFRAKSDGERKPWQQWSGPSRDGHLRGGDYLEQLKSYHLFVQWLAEQQVRALGAHNDVGAPALYLDFPLGVNRDGYDVWREREAFALDANGGAPPDGFFVKGQDWGFPPLHPEGLRRQGYRYFIDCVRHHLAHAKMLRIDHVMGLYRFFWIPQGFAPTEGAYVRYPAEEFFAILNLESHRNHARIVGENLGTVPPAVNQAMARHNFRGMHVGQFGVTSDPNRALDPVPESAVVSLNTHDTPTFAGFWSGADIDDRVDLGLLTAEQAHNERQGRANQRAALTAYLKSLGLLEGEDPNPAAVLRAWLLHLAAGDAEFLLVNLEDLWLEPAPQNVPGTWQERPNWQRKARYSMTQLREFNAMRDTLVAIDRARRNESESDG